jgi:hypothetical protein
MGVWGTGPFDNDDAGDMVAKMMKSIQAVANKGDDSLYYEARAHARFVLAAHGTDILGGPGLAPVIRALARMRMDREWLGNWKDPRKIADALDLELSAAFDRMHACRGCSKSLSKGEWRELGTLVVKARSQPVPRSTIPKRARPVSRAAKATVKKLIRTKAPKSKQ